MGRLRTTNAASTATRLCIQVTKCVDMASWVD